MANGGEILTGLRHALKTKNIASILAHLYSKSTNWLNSEMENGTSGYLFNDLSVGLVDAFIETLRWTSSERPDLAPVWCQ